MKHRARYLIPTALLVVAVALGLWWYLSRPPELPEWITPSNGRIEMTRTDIAAKYPGRLISLAIHEGDDVRAGQVIARQDDADLLTQMAGARAKREEAVAALARAQGERAARDSQARLARLDWAQSGKLHAREMVSDVELAQRRLALGAAVAGVDAAGGGVGQARAAIAQADAQIAQVKAMLGDLHIVAPTAGRVEYRIAEPGTVLPSGGRIVSLINPQDVYLTIFVPASVAGSLQIGDEARVVPQGFSQVLPARVSFVSPEAQFTPKFVETANERDNLSYRVKLQIPAEIARRLGGQLKAGMTADGYVRTDPRRPWPHLAAGQR